MITTKQKQQLVTLIDRDDIQEVARRCNVRSAFGIPFLDEAVLTEILCVQHRTDVGRMIDIFSAKKDAGLDPKKWGYGVFYRKKFYEMITLYDALDFLWGKKSMLSSKADVGISDNKTGRFLFFDEGRRLNGWLATCLKNHAVTLNSISKYLSLPPINECKSDIRMVK